MYVRDRCGNIIFDASVHDHKGCMGEKELQRTIVSSSCAQILTFYFLFLLTKLKENQSEKLSVI